MAMGGTEDRTGDQEETPAIAEQLLDLMVYLPIGVATAVVEDLPRFAARGRAAVEGRIRTARGIGEVTVVLGRRSLASRLRRPGSATSQPGSGHRMPPPQPPPPPPPPETAAVEVEVEVDTIIAGYDTLPASQVVRRLDGLSPAELADIGRYESAGRGRRTILHRVRQIQAAQSDPPASRSD